MMEKELTLTNAAESMLMVLTTRKTKLSSGNQLDHLFESMVDRFPDGAQSLRRLPTACDVPALDTRRRLLGD